MYCKFCGKSIESITKKCPYCGASTKPLSGGNGFYDVLSAPTKTESVLTQVVEIDERVPENRTRNLRKASNHKNSIKQNVVLVVSIFALATSLLTAFNSTMSNKEIEKKYHQLLTVIDEYHRNDELEITVPEQPIWWPEDVESEEDELTGNINEDMFNDVTLNETTDESEVDYFNHEETRETSFETETAAPENYELEEAHE